MLGFARVDSNHVSLPQLYQQRRWAERERRHAEQNAIEATISRAAWVDRLKQSERTNAKEYKEINH